jgi:hypothetical protein
MYRRISLSPLPAPPVNSGDPLRMMPMRPPVFAESDFFSRLGASPTP